MIDSTRKLSLAAASRLPILKGTAAFGNEKLLWRWARKGVGGVLLETWNVGKQVTVTPGAIRLFLQAINEQRRPAESSAMVSPTHAAAVRAAHKLGWGEV